MRVGGGGGERKRHGDGREMIGWILKEREGGAERDRDGVRETQKNTDRDCERDRQRQRGTHGEAHRDVKTEKKRAQ